MRQINRIISVLRHLFAWRNPKEITVILGI